MERSNGITEGQPEKKTEDSESDLKIKYIPAKQQEYKIKQPNKMLPQLYFTFIIAGSRGSGKSQLIRNLLLRQEMMKGIFKPEHIFIFSPSLKVNGDYDDIKAKYKFDYYSDEIIARIMELQQAIIKKFKKRSAPPLLLIFDDCLDLKNCLTWNSLLETIFIRGRHLNISIAIVTQHLNKVSRTMRLNQDYVAFFKPTNTTELDNFVEQNFSKTDRKKVYNQISNIFANNPYSFILIDNKTKDENMKYRVNFDRPLFSTDNI